jgi:hypothetical protein
MEEGRKRVLGIIGSTPHLKSTEDLFDSRQPTHGVAGCVRRPMGGTDQEKDRQGVCQLCQ